MHSPIVARAILRHLTYYVFTNEVCKRRSDVSQFITTVSQRILRSLNVLFECGFKSKVRLPFGPYFVRPVRPFVRPSARFVRSSSGSSADGS
uniref:Uncharacterized protein n=1 Tax=Caenorhabditis japonica TaxID=281687 RepID=A0A8R1IE77_CAEJA